MGFTEFMNDKGEIETEDIKKIVPYQEPFLFLDKVIKLEPNRIVAIKHVNGSEDFLKGHFVDFPIMPGALTVEGMGQAATLLARSNLPNHQEKDVLAYKIKEVKFMLPIFPGSEIRFDVEFIAMDERGAVCHGKAFLKEALAAEAYFIIAIVNKSDFRVKRQ